MKTITKRLLFWATLAALGAGLLWSHQRHQAAPEHEEAAAAEEKKADGEEHTVKLSLETQKRIGLALARPTALELAPAATAYGQVVDPSPLAALDAELTTAEEALATSRATAERERGLFAQQQNISRKVLEVSEAQLRSDETRARAARRRLQLEWGETLASLAPPERGHLLDALAQGKSALVKVDVPAGAPLTAAPTGATVTLLGHEDEPIAVESVSAAAAVDPKTQAQGFLLLLTQPALVLRPGAAVVARLALAGEKMEGVVIPRSAVVRQEGKGWVFVKKGKEEFVRVEVSLEHATSQGWFTTEGFPADDEVVVTGAQSLLSEELKGQMAEE